jgi:trehalose 6-phosphate phosphatase
LTWIIAPHDRQSFNSSNYSIPEVITGAQRSIAGCGVWRSGLVQTAPRPIDIRAHRDGIEIRPERFDAILVDLDGVVTRTAQVHAAAWKEIFDAYLRARASRLGRHFDPFDPVQDYQAFVDGKPRFDGVQSFLDSRNIVLPPGRPQDSPDSDTVWGLAARKNACFHQLLQRRGVELYASTIRCLEGLKALGLQIGVVSSSRNCARILELAGLAAFFDAKVDGVDMEECWLAGKPAPDLFLEGARRLDAEPERTIVVEDALAGVEAGRRGGFGLVIGVARGGNGAAMLDRGAGIVVSDLDEVVWAERRRDRGLRSPREVGSDRLAEHVLEASRSRQLAVFLDYDGTLTPIVDHPERAVLGQDMRRVLRRLAKHCVVAVISGRKREDVERLVDLYTVYYAGSHGFDISGPDGAQIHHEEGAGFIPMLQEAERELRTALEAIDGAIVEGKRFSVAVHYRLVHSSDLERVRDAVNRTMLRFPELRRSLGKKVFELRPAMDWDKGKAMLWLIEALKLDKTAVYPIYVGDDWTDEDAFEALAENGLGVLVAGHARLSHARFRLRDPKEVKQFLNSLLSTVGSPGT